MHQMDGSRLKDFDSATPTLQDLWGLVAGLSVDVKDGDVPQGTEEKMMICWSFYCVKPPCQSGADIQNNGHPNCGTWRSGRAQDSYERALDVIELIIASHIPALVRPGSPSFNGLRFLIYTLRCNYFPRASTIMKNFFFASLASCIDLATALLLPKNASLSTTFPSLQARTTSCANSATSRGCWGNYSIDTNFYEETPDTGVTREYWLNVQNTTLAPDVSSRSRPPDFCEHQI